MLGKETHFLVLLSNLFAISADKNFLARILEATRFRCHRDDAFLFIILLFDQQKSPSK